MSAPYSGIEVHFRLLAREFAASDRVDGLDAIWLEHQPGELIARVPPFRWNWFLAAALSTSRQAGDLRRNGSRPDVALVNHVNPALLLGPRSTLPPVVLHLDTTPLVTSSMGEQYLGRPPRPAVVEYAKLALYRRSLGVPRHIIAVSDLVRRSLIEDYRVAGDSISVIPFPVDTSYWSRRPGSATRTDALRILFVGADWRRKGGDQVLAAARRPEFAAYEFHVVTRTDVTDTPANVFVHRDVGPGSERLRELFSSASIFVLPTFADLSPIVLTEAMAMELPIVTTDVGAISELVRDDHDGYMVRPGDSGAFVERLRALTDSADLRAAMGRRGRSKVESDHSITSNVPRYLDVIEGRTREPVGHGS